MIQGRELNSSLKPGMREVSRPNKAPRELLIKKQAASNVPAVFQCSVLICTRRPVLVTFAEVFFIPHAPAWLLLGGLQHGGATHVDLA